MMIIRFRQLILENYTSVTLRLTSPELSNVVLEMLGILSMIMQSKFDPNTLAYQYCQNPDLFVDYYADLYCKEFKLVRESMPDRFTSETLRDAKDFIKKIINFSSTHPDSKITEYVKFIKIKK